MAVVMFHYCNHETHSPDTSDAIKKNKSNIEKSCWNFKNPGEASQVGQIIIILEPDIEQLFLHLFSIVYL